MRADNTTRRIVNSALWSAYADALGFITELRDNSAAISARIGSEKVTEPVNWRRRVGGRMGAEALLPAGTYSDDTQLRLATSRAIRPDFSFNVEAFAKMELPVWTCYALGAGRGSKTAASALSRDGVNWYSNFFRSGGTSYNGGGGNGAAMRIQPHAWAAPERISFDEFALSVLKNAVCTHGHSRALAGALFHASCVRHALISKTVPDIELWMRFIAEVERVPEILHQDADLRMFWIPVWERESGPLASAFKAVSAEMRRDIDTLAKIQGYSAGKEERYRRALEELNAFEEHERGSGTKTALLAAFNAQLFSEAEIETALLCAVNALQSDTDTIATMAGAILGATTVREPAGPLQDKAYIVAQAERAARISLEQDVEQTAYPNLLTWKPPQTQQDSVLAGERGLEVLVLGKVVTEGPSFERKQGDSTLWQWLTLESGQSILAKRKRNPWKFMNSQMALPTVTARNEQLAFSSHSTRTVVQRSRSVHELTSEAIAHNFDPRILGEHLLLLSAAPDGVERAIAYAAIIAKARIARSRR